MSEGATKLSAPLEPPNPNLSFVEVLEVEHFDERVFAFTCTRPSTFRFRSGEFVMLGLMSGDRPLLRAYSIASPAWEDVLKFYSIKAPDGPLTSRLQEIAPGDRVLLGKKPTGTLVLDALLPGRRLFLLSTGTGVAPFVSLIREPETYERFDEVILVHACRVRSELQFGFDSVASAYDDPLVGELARVKLRHLTSLTRAPHALQGRITTLIENEDLFRALAGPSFNVLDDRIMICGSTAMLNDLKDMMIAAGFTEGSNQAPGAFVVERAFVG